MATLREQLEIPKTQSRLKSLIKVFGSHGGYDPSLGIPSFAKLEFIGAVSRVELRVTRGATERRELNYDNLGKILEMVPGLVSFEMSMNYVWLYTASFLEASGFGGHTLEFQTRPMVYLLRLPSPNPDVIPDRSIIMENCWIGENSGEFSVEEKDDLRIIQTVPIHVGGLREVK